MLATLCVAPINPREGSRLWNFDSDIYFMRLTYDRSHFCKEIGKETMDLSDFDYELVAQNVFAQNVALEQSCKQKLDHEKIYEDTLQEYREKKREFLEAKQQREALSWKLSEKLRLKNSLSLLQILPNSKANTNHDETLALYERMEKDIGQFVSSVNTVVDKIQGLGAEFDDSIMENRKRECANKTENLVNEIENKRKSFNLKKNSKKEYEYNNEICCLGMALKRSLTHSDSNKIKMELSENRRKQIPIEKNIHFLKQQNHELQVQLEKSTKMVV